MKKVIRRKKRGFIALSAETKHNIDVVFTTLLGFASIWVLAALLS